MSFLLELFAVVAAAARPKSVSNFYFALPSQRPNHYFSRHHAIFVSSLSLIPLFAPYLFPLLCFRSPISRFCFLSPYLSRFLKISPRSPRPAFISFSLAAALSQCPLEKEYSLNRAFSLFWMAEISPGKRSLKETKNRINSV